MKIPNAQLALALAVLSWPKANSRDQTTRAQGYLQWLEEQEQQLFKEPPDTSWVHMGDVTEKD